MHRRILPLLALCLTALTGCQRNPPAAVLGLSSGGTLDFPTPEFKYSKVPQDKLPADLHSMTRVRWEGAPVDAFIVTEPVLRGQDCATYIETSHRQHEAGRANEDPAFRAISRPGKSARCELSKGNCLRAEVASRPPGSVETDDPFVESDAFVQCRDGQVLLVSAMMKPGEALTDEARRLLEQVARSWKPGPAR